MPALIVLAGAFGVAIGTFWASWRQWNFNTVISEKNEEIIRLQRENVGVTTGGDSFCYMLLQVHDPATGLVVTPIFIHQGRFPLYDVAARVVDIDEMRKSIGANQAALLGTTLRVGNLTPGFSVSITILQHPAGQNFNYNVFYVARNGAWLQMLRMRWLGNGWAIATRVLEGNGGPKVLYEEISADYPRGADGQVEWNEKPKTANP
jgi:hypothetical protein